jgi:hypothetical protein
LDNKTALLTDSGNERNASSSSNRKLIYGLIGVSSAALLLGIIGVSRSTGGGSNSADSTGINAANGAFKESFTIPAFGFAVEGFNYDTFSQRFLFGSIGQKGIYSLDPSDSTASAPAISTFWHNDGKVVDGGILGVYLDSNSSSTQYNLWAAISNFSPTNKNIGVLQYNLLTGENKIHDLTAITGSNVNLLNDLVVDPKGNVYVTNMQNGQIFRIKKNSSNGEYSPEVFVTGSQFTPTVDFNTFHLGFDGIEYNDGYVLAGVYSPAAYNGGLYRISESNPTDAQKVKVNDGTELFYVDGVRFNKDHSKLYVCSGQSSLIILSSKDKWATADVVQNIDLSKNANVKLPVTSVTLIPDPATGNDMVYVLTAAGFGQGPYSIVRVL